MVSKRFFRKKLGLAIGAGLLTFAIVPATIAEIPTDEAYAATTTSDATGGVYEVDSVTYTYSVKDSGAYITGIHGSGQVTVPSTIADLPVVAINCGGGTIDVDITSVTVQAIDSLTSAAFNATPLQNLTVYKCSNLRTFSATNNPGLETVRVGYTIVSNWEFLNNPVLKNLYLTSNYDATTKQGMTSFNFAMVPTVQNLDMSWNGLTSASLVSCKNLTSAQLAYCPLESINVQGLTKLEELNVNACKPLASLNVSGLTSLVSLQCNVCDLTSLNLAGCVNLETLDCSFNKLQSIDVTGLVNLRTLSCTNNYLSGTNYSDLVLWGTRGGHSLDIDPQLAPPASDEGDGSTSGPGWHQTPNGQWTYTGTNGQRVKGWRSIDGAWYYFNTQGFMQTGWQKIDGVWYYLGATSGAMVSGGWEFINGNWYHFADSGAMDTGWLYSGRKWYFLSNSGAMAADQWIASGGKWYYLTSSGAMATNTWVGNYYVDGSGVWTRTR